ncbi:hypothetical protein B566_EDAN013524 [Ephemera danica]|nr:hypothetical protein B566_EDAN013524 [Ephemera danica]
MSTTGAALLLVLLAARTLQGHYHPPAAEVLTGPSASHQHHLRGPHHPRGSAPRHDHYTPQRGDAHPTKLTQDTELLHDEEHIREDLGNLLTEEDTKKMSTEELEFHYFKLHDFDNNTKLDGLEILRAIQHIVHDDKEPKGETKPEKPEPSSDDLEYYIAVVE